MEIEVTEEAVAVLKRSFELAKIDPATGGVRLRVARGLGGGASVQLEFAESPTDSEVVVESGGIRLFADPALPEAIPNPVVAVEPQHDRVVVRPS
jgi:Fe-S cluster assembly iron-binding protein IscA